MLDEITEAVLSREEIARYLDGSRGEGGRAARERIEGYIEELHTTQRYSIYRALKHPLYPILRKIERVAERIDLARAATRAGRVVYASNHKSHTDYLVELLVLDENGMRPPIIAAGINLFGGPLGLLHRHITGAMPVRRNTKDPAYLMTLKAYVGELLREHDLFFYPEGGRSYSGDIKTPKTGSCTPRCRRNTRTWSCFPRPWPTTWCSRITCWRASASSARSGRSAASWRRWCAAPSDTGRARS